MVNIEIFLLLLGGHLMGRRKCVEIGKILRDVGNFSRFVAFHRRTRCHVGSAMDLIEGGEGGGGGGGERDGYGYGRRTRKLEG